MKICHSVNIMQTVIKIGLYINIHLCGSLLAPCSFTQSHHHLLLFHHCFSHPSLSLLLVCKKQKAVEKGGVWSSGIDCKSLGQSLALQSLSPTLNLFSAFAPETLSITKMKSGHAYPQYLPAFNNNNYPNIIELFNYKFHCPPHYQSALSIQSIFCHFQLTSLRIGNSSVSEISCSAACLMFSESSPWAHFSPAQTLLYWQISTHPLNQTPLWVNYPCLCYHTEMYSSLNSRLGHNLADCVTGLVDMFQDTVYTRKDYILGGASCGGHDCPSTIWHPLKAGMHSGNCYECTIHSVSFLHPLLGSTNFKPVQLSVWTRPALCKWPFSTGCESPY